MKHYIKNVLIFIPIIFNGDLFDITLFLTTLIGFAGFCMISSIVYIINDLCDFENDKTNSLKNKRPIANGDISKSVAYVIIIVLFTLYVLLIKHITNGVIIPLAYLMINIAYSFGLKNIPILDIGIIACGFILRVFYGGLITDIEISQWVYLTIIAGSVYLGLGKRRGELICNTEGKRKSLSKYSLEFLDKNMYMCLSLCLVFYSLACINVNTKVNQMGRNLLWSVALVLIIALKYNLNLECANDGDPTNIILCDKYLFGMILFLLIGVIITIYF